MRARKAWILGLVVIGLVTAGCQSSDQAASPGTTTRTPVSLPPQLGGPRPAGTQPVSTTTQPPVTFEGNPSAEQVLVAVDDKIPMSDGERSCAATKLAADTDLLSRVKVGVAPGSADFSTLVGFANDCRRTVTNARETAEAINRSRGGRLTPQQVDCLANAYGALSPDDLETVISAGVSPKGSLAPRGNQLLTELLSKCDVT